MGVGFSPALRGVQISKDGKLTTLKGIEEGSRLKISKAELKTITSTQWYKESIGGSRCAIGHLIPTEDRGEEEANIPTKVQQILTRYQDVFREPSGVPPSRHQDHRVPLLPDAKPVNIRPYRYTHEQKN